jgi:riboflavin synthase
MFTGLVQGVASVVDARPVGDAIDLEIEFDALGETIELGESIAIDGCCLTVSGIQENKLIFQAGSETLAKTTLGKFQSGRAVNFERAMRMSDRLGGHIVSGHVDCVGEVRKRFNHADWADITFSIPKKYLGQIVPKGSVTINGVSLTIVDVDDEGFNVALIPHTLAVTNIGQLGVGDKVNIETDVIAKYVERLMQFNLVRAAQ